MYFKSYKGQYVIIKFKWNKIKPIGLIQRYNYRQLAIAMLFKYHNRDMSLLFIPIPPHDTNCHRFVSPMLQQKKICHCCVGTMLQP